MTTPCSQVYLRLLNLILSTSAPRNSRSEKELNHLIQSAIISHSFHQDFLSQGIRLKPNNDSRPFKSLTLLPRGQLPFSSPIGCGPSLGFEMPHALPTPSKTILARPQAELSGKRPPGARRFSHFFRAGGRAGGGRGKVPSAASPGAILEGGIARSFREGRSPARKGPAAARRCLSGAGRAAGPPPALEAGGPSQAGCAVRPSHPFPCPHSHLVPSPPSRRAPEACGAGAERGGECGRRAWAGGLAGRA